ncbi:MICAL-like protein 1 isoform X2 [Centruroides vittatus]|uniref:MICAL-like protein 1 isoform X2 n=1 Tax=Centruroides vittatus TaxID=120091 RepID=UPI00350FB783
MAEKRGLKGLEEWCRRITEGYDDVRIKDMSHSWRDGLAFCAIIHHFVPDLIDFNSLSKENILHNNSLAFGIAEKQLGIPALLDAEDMVNCIEPDRLSIATYLSQLYQYFEGGGNKRFSDSSKFLKQEFHTQNFQNDSIKKLGGTVTEFPSRKKYETCQSCKHRVFILERLMVDGKLYHRTCFKCCRCQALLKPGAYNEGEVPGTYECTICPRDEEAESLQADLSVNESEEKSNIPLDSSENITRKESFQTKRVSDTFTKARKVFLQNNLNKETEIKLHKESFHKRENIPESNYLKNNGEIEETDRSFDLKKKETDRSFDLKKEETEDQTSLEMNKSEKISNQMPLLKKPPIAKKPDFSHISKCSNSSRENDNSENIEDNLLSKDTAKTDISSPLKYQSVFNTYKPFIYSQNEETKSIHLKSLQRSISEQKCETNDQIKSISELPVIKSSKENVPFLSRSLLRTTSENNIQQTAKLSRLSEALLFPTKGKENEELENVLHSKWSKQGTYHKMYSNKSFTNLTDLKNSFSKKTDSSNDEYGNLEFPCEKIKIGDSGSEKDIESNIICEDEKKEVDSVCVKEEDKLVCNEKNEEIDTKNDTSIENNEKLDSIKLHNETDEQKINISKSQVIEVLQSNTSEVTSELSDSVKIDYPIDLNPFGDDDDESEMTAKENYPDDLNPFDTSEDEDDDDETLSLNKSSILSTDSCNVSIDNDEYDRNFNPFYSSDDDCKSNGSDIHSHSSFDSHYSSSNISELRNEIKKKRKAPLPPTLPQSLLNKENLRNEFKTDKKIQMKQIKPSPRLSQKKIAPKPPVSIDDKQNTTDSEVSENVQNKLEKEGKNVELSIQPVTSKPKQWRRKKRPAPSVPVPRKREIKMIPIENIKAEMLDIEKKQQQLEKRGRELEMLIREREDSEISMEEEKAILDLFELVNLKNALFRRQAELMYIKRSQRLEEEQVEIEFQIRCLMNKPANERREEDALKEEELLQRLLDVVEQRNEIVDTIEMDRKRELQEDKSIKEHMDQKQTEMKEKWKGTLKKKIKNKDKTKSKGKNKKQSSSKGEQTKKDSKHKKNWF